MRQELLDRLGGGGCRRPVAVASLLVLAACGPRQDGARDQIRGLVAKYARSIDAADTNLAAEVWSQSRDVSFIHPLGHEHGWDGIKRNVYERLMRDNFAARRLSIRDLAVHAYGDAAWAEFYWTFHATWKRDGSPLETNGRETQIYHRATGGRWELVHVHYSALPAPPGRGQGF